MGSCNLMPREFRDDYVRQVRVRFWAVTVGMVLLVGLGWVGWEFHMYRAARHAYKVAEKQQEGIRNQINGLSNSESLLERWQSQLALQRRLGLYPHAVEVLSALATQTPQKIFLSRLDLMPWQDEPAEEDAAEGPPLPAMAQMFLLRSGALPAGKPQTTKQKPEANEEKNVRLPEFLRGPFRLGIFGIAQDSDAIADYLLALRATGCFRTISLADLTRNINDPRVMQFEIRCTLKRTGQRQEGEHAAMPTAENL